MKRLKSPTDLTRSFANGFVLQLPANEWVVCEDTIAQEMKFVYPFIEMGEATEEDLKAEVVKEVGIEEVEEVKEVKVEERDEEIKEEVKKRRGRPSKK